MTRAQKFILSGIAITAAMLAGWTVGGLLREAWGMGSWLAWFGLAAFGWVWVSGRKV